VAKGSTKSSWQAAAGLDFAARYHDPVGDSKHQCINSLTIRYLSGTTHTELAATHSLLALAANLPPLRIYWRTAVEHRVRVEEVRPIIHHGGVIFFSRKAGSITFRVKCLLSVLSVATSLRGASYFALFEW